MIQNFTVYTLKKTFFKKGIFYVEEENIAECTTRESYEEFQWETVWEFLPKNSINNLPNEIKVVIVDFVSALGDWNSSSIWLDGKKVLYSTDSQTLEQITDEVQADLNSFKEFAEKKIKETEKILEFFKTLE